MSIEQELTNNLLEDLLWSLPKHKISGVYHYAVFPPGKLFRPKLVHAVALDLTNSFSKNHRYLASSIETHHAYTLVHDDLPCMDNDLMRRGRPTVHAQFGEWQAVLTGDALMSSSYALLSKIHHERLRELLSLFSWATGAKGLIHGQVMDLSLEMNSSTKNLIETHNLKTARLIQTALVGSSVLSNAPLKVSYDFFRFGRALGISFQLIDDLCELGEENLTDHEIAINPWIKDGESIQKMSLNYLAKIEKFFKTNNYANLKIVTNSYLTKMSELISTKSETISKQTKTDLNPLVSALNRINL